MLPPQFKPPVQSAAVQFAEPPAQFVPFPTRLQTLETSLPVLSSHSQVAGLIQLDFAEVRPFETVRMQYQEWGIEFDGAIALQPSNPAFTKPNQLVGLAPLVDRLPLTIYFDQPRQLVSAKLTAARQITVKVFDAANRLILKQHLGQAQYLTAQTVLPIGTEYEMQLQADAIARIEIQSDVPFMLHQLVCS